VFISKIDTVYLPLRVDSVSYILPAELHLISENIDNFTLVRHLNMANIALDCRNIPSHPKRPAATYSVSFTGQMVDVFEPPKIKHEKGIHIGMPWQLGGPTYYGKTGTWGWWTRIWVPVPVCLLDKVETKKFRLDVRFQMVEGSEPLKASEEMSVSHLRRDKEMKGLD
jgi:hypothetical protein